MSKPIIYYYRLLRFLFKRQKKYPKWKLFSNITVESAEKLAEQRRQAINELFELSQFIEIEFYEFPNDEKIAKREQRYFETKEEIYGQTARLKWQLNSTEFLLLDRLVDLVIILLGDSSEFVNSYPLIKLEPFDKYEKKEGYFGWKAIIETEYPIAFYEALHRYESWIGIQIEIREKRYNTIMQTGRCTNYNEEGTIGGIIECNTGEYAMTCSHVLNQNCCSLRFRGNPYLALQYNNHTIYQAPDAALIDVNSTCFPIRRGVKTPLRCATDQVILTAANSRTLLDKIPIENRRKPGIVITPVGFMPVNNRGDAYRFPHIIVRLYQKSYFFGFIKWPLSSYFSREGESGSWVIDNVTNIWYGMIIGGDNLANTYIAHSEPLLEFFSYQIGMQPNLKITPFIYH